MESIVKKITQKTQDSLSILKAKSDELQNQALDLMNKGLTVEATKLTNEKIAPIINEYERIQTASNQEIESISRRSLEGIASGESISDKETRKQYDAKIKNIYSYTDTQLERFFAARYK